MVNGDIELAQPISCNSTKLNITKLCIYILYNHYKIVTPGPRAEFHLMEPWLLGSSPTSNPSISPISAPNATKSGRLESR